MTVGTSATLIPVAHDWTSTVTIEPAQPTAILPHDDGSEQRLSLSHLATERVTYRLVAPDNIAVATIMALVDLATDTWVRVPRWEDQARLSDAVTAGSAVVIPCDTTNKPTMIAGRQVILWRSATSYEVTTCDALSDTDVTADLASDWGAGTIIAPVMPGRVVLPLNLSHWVPTSGVLEFAVDFDLADLAGVGTGGTATTGTADAIALGDVVVGKYGRGAIAATVTDAAGNVLPGDGIVWTSSDPTNAPVYATSTPSVAMVENPNGVLSNKTITATLGALSDTGTAYLIA